MARQTRFGSPPLRPRSESTYMVVEPFTGMMGNHAPSNLPPGGTPVSDIGQNPIAFSMNFVASEGGISPRPKLTQHTGNSNPMGVMVTGGAQIVSSVGTPYNLVSGTSRFAYYSASSYSPLSQVSAGGVSFWTWSATTRDRTDFTQIYEATNDEMLAIVSTTSSYNTLMTWKAGATVFSTLTQAPKARWVAAYDNFVIAGNIQDSTGSKYVQRVQWSDRGNPFVWTPASGNLAGNQDLLDAKGQIRRIMTQEDRIVLFFDNEIWTGVRGDFPNTFRFTPADRSVGTPYGRTCAQTPRGIMFLGKDLQIYLLPNTGGPVEAIGSGVRQFLRRITTFQDLGTAWAVYASETGEAMHLSAGPGAYQLYFPMGHGVANEGLPVGALYCSIEDGSFMFQKFTNDVTNVYRSLTAGWTGLREAVSAGTTWSSASTAVMTWDTAIGSWDDYTAHVTAQHLALFAGTSSGTVYYMNSLTPWDDGTTIYHVWNSPILWGEAPNRSKCVTGFRVDYKTSSPSTISVRFSQGTDSLAGYSPAQAIALNNLNTHYATGAAYPYATATNPSFQVSSTDQFFRLYRFWVAGRIGGRDAAP